MYVGGEAKFVDRFTATVLERCWRVMCAHMVQLGGVVVAGIAHLPGV